VVIRTTRQQIVKICETLPGKLYEYIPYKLHVGYVQVVVKIPYITLLPYALSRPTASYTEDDMSDLNMPKPVEEVKKVLSPEKSYWDINEKLMEMAGMGKISATAYMITIFNSQLQLQGEFPPNSIFAALISDRKQYAPFYINKYRVVGLVDSGADMSCMHDTLLPKILPKSKWKFDKPQELISASGDTMKSLGNLDIDIYLSP